jgi:hypothetical protein
MSETHIYKIHVIASLMKANNTILWFNIPVNQILIVHALDELDELLSYQYRSFH